MPSSDSDSLPVFPSGPPKRKKPGLRPNGTAKAAGPIELTSDDEPKIPPPKRKRKSACTSASTNVIDLCSDDHETIPWPPRKARRSQTHAPREDEIIVLMSSDNEEPSPSCSQPPGSKTMGSDRKSFSPIVSVSPIDMLRPEGNDFATDTDSASGQPELPTTQMGSSPASPMADFHEAQLPTNQQAKGMLQAEDEITSEPLQHIYNEAFQNRSQCKQVKPPSLVFSWKSRSKPTQICKPHPLPSSDSPLLTPGFFKRVREALAVPQNPTTSVQNDLVKASSPVLQRATTAVKSDPVPFTHSSVSSGVGERESKPLSAGPSPRKSQTEYVKTVEKISEENDLPGISPGVVKAGALHTASPSSPAKEPNYSKTPQTEFMEQANTINVHETTSTMSHISPSTSPLKSIATSKTVPINSQQLNAFGPSEAEIQEIETMLLPKTYNDMTDEELLAMGLCYPEY